jgi:hypothetical protein
MTLHDPGPRRQPRRIGLYAPFVLLLLFAILWSGAWIWLRGEVERRLEALRRPSQASGWGLDWSEATVSGYPFRLDLRMTGLRLAEASGRRIAVPLLKAEALVLTPGHWVIEVPSDVTVTQPNGDGAMIRSQILRASVSDLGARPPRISVEAIGVSVTGAADANPLFFTAADEAHLHARAGPLDQGAAYVEVDGATPTAAGWLGPLAGGKPATLTFDTIYSHAGAMTGSTWRTMIAAWSGAGGDFALRVLKLSTGDVGFDARPGRLRVDHDGRLAGSLDATVRGGPQAIAALARAGVITPAAAEAATTVLSASRSGPATSVQLHFEAGQTTLGPAAIGPSPRVY